MILLVTSSYPDGPGDFRGAFVRTFALSLERSGHKVEVLTPLPCAPRIPATVKGNSSEPKIHHVGWGRAGERPFGSVFGGNGILENVRSDPFSIRHFPLAIDRFARAIEHHAAKASAVVAHWLLPFGLVAAATRRRHGLPVWIVCHSGGVRVLAWLPAPVQHAVGKTLADSCDLLSFVTPQLRDELLDLVGPFCATLRPRCRILPMGVDVDRFRPVSWLPTGCLASVGRLTRLKAVDRLIVSMARQPSCPSCVIAGDGPERARLQRLASDLGVEARFLGEVPTDSVPRVLHRSSAAVLPSKRLVGGRCEGLPTTALETLAAGLPLVTTDTWDMPEVFRELPGVFRVADSTSGVAAGLSEALLYLETAKLSDASLRQGAVHTFQQQNLATKASQYIEDLMAA